MALYYKVMKSRSRQMRTAVRCNSKHKAARAELEQLSRRDSALAGLKIVQVISSQYTGGVGGRSPPRTRKSKNVISPAEDPP